MFKAIFRGPSADFVRRQLAGHGALGLFFAGLLYVVCLSGAVVVFHPEFERWERPDGPEMPEAAPELVDRAVRALLAAVPQPPPRIFVVLPGPASPRLVLLAGKQGWLADAEGRLAGQASHDWTEFVTDLHIRLHVPGVLGSTLVGMLGAALVGLILSGLLAHPRLFRDAFLWRRGGNAKLERADLHNRIGVWGTPLFLALALTGAFIGLANVMIFATAKTLYSGDLAAVTRPILGAQPIASADPAPLPDLAGPLRQVRTEHPDLPPLYLAVEAVGTTAQQVHVYTSVPNRLVYAERFQFDGQGRFTGTLGLSDGDLGRQIYASLYPVHFGSYGGLPVKLAYALLGLGLAVVCASGTSLWLMRRRDRGRAMAWLERVWAGLTWGVPVLFALTALALPVLDLPPVPLFWGGLAVILFGAGLWRRLDPALLSRRLRLAGALLVALVPVAQAARFGADALGPAALGVNAGLLLTALLLAAPFLPRPLRRPAAAAHPTFRRSL